MSANVNGQFKFYRDPELQYTSSGDAFCKFSLGWVNTFGKKNETGKYNLSFINCIAWSKTAEFIAKFFKKGSIINIDHSELGNDQYIDKTGNKKDSWVLNIKSVSFPINNPKETEKQESKDYSNDDPWAEGNT